MPERTISEITDAEIDTLGLVSKGANGEEVLLLKAAEDAELEEISKCFEEQITKNVWQRLVDLFKSTKKEPEVVEPEVVNPVVEPIAEVIKSEPIVELVAEPVVAESTITKEVSRVTEPAIHTNLGDAPMPEQNVEFEKATAEIADLKKSQTDLLARLEKAETEATQAREERERLTYFSKAQGFVAVPVPTAEIADHMYWLAKTDAKRAQWFEDLLKATDNLIADSEVFVEKGTSRVAPDAIEKAMASADPKAELLKIGRADAEAYLKSVRVK
jgi:hypothetical protein